MDILVQGGILATGCSCLAAFPGKGEGLIEVSRRRKVTELPFHVCNDSVGGSSTAPAGWASAPVVAGPLHTDTACFSLRSLSGAGGQETLRQRRPGPFSFSLTAWLGEKEVGGLLAAPLSRRLWGGQGTPSLPGRGVLSDF